MNNLQKALLNLWIKVKKVLDDENITYFAIGGTAIGALREKGFIPWDDDMDFCIISEDYERAIKALENSGLATESKYLKFNPYPFKKVFGKDEISAFGEKDNIYIDLFIAQHEIKWTKFSWFLFKSRDLLLYAKSKKIKNWIKGSSGKFVYFGLLFAKLLTCWLPTRLLQYLQKNRLSKPPIKNSNHNVRYMYFKENDTPMRINKLKEIKFETSSVVVSETFADDHKHIFGDIMVKPKENKIINHNIKLINEEEKND